MPGIAEEDLGYVCTLTETSLKKAKEELNEDPNERLTQVDALRQWIKTQPHLQCPTDTEFLLLYLRGAKFSQLRAREMIDAIFTLKTEKMTWFANVDTHEARVAGLLKSGATLILPKKDPDGRRIMLSRVSRIDPKILPQDRICLNTVLMSYITRDENVQVNGLVMMIDFTGMTTKHLTMMSNSMEMKKMSQAMQKNMPGRIKAFHYYNVGGFLEFLMGIVKQVMREKFRSRIQVHSTMESLYKQIPMECFPTEYLPDDYNGPSAGSLDSIQEDLLKEVQTPEFRDYLLQRTSSDYKVDESKRVKVDETASFRKLNID